MDLKYKLLMIKKFLTNHFLEKLSSQLERFYHKNNLDFLVIKGGQEYYSFVYMTALFISNINYAVLPEDLDDERIERLFNPKKIAILKIKNDQLILTDEKSIETFKEKINKARINNKRKILYLSSGSTGDPKLIELTSKSAFNCHEKVIKKIDFKKNINYVVCFHSNSFVISLNYLMIGILSDINVLTIYKGGPLKLILLLKKIGKESLIISVPSYWESYRYFRKQSIRINSIISCGEPLKFETAKKLRKLANNKLFNFYGATEFATWIFFFEITEKYLSNFTKIQGALFQLEYHSKK